MAFGDLRLQSVTRPVLLAPYISRAPGSSSTAGPGRAQQAGAAALQPPDLVRTLGMGQERHQGNGGILWCCGATLAQSSSAQCVGMPWGPDIHLCEPGHIFAWASNPASTVFQRVKEAWHRLEGTSHSGMAGAGAAESPSIKGYPVPSTALTSGVHPAKLTGS